MAQVITLTTDFGTGDTYVASMKGVILTINPEAVIVDICHSIEPQNILQAAFLISTAHKYFPTKTIHLVIVDPEVGSQRRAILLKTPSAYFLAPDNGVLSYIITELEPAILSKSSDSLPYRERRKGHGGIEAIAITNDNFWRYPVSHLFHGRDIFAPVAAHLSLGTPLQEFGENIEHIHTFPIPCPRRDAQGNMVGHVLHIDSFGNLVTDIKDDVLGGEVVIEVAGQYIHGLSQFYNQREGLVALIGSNGNLEISLNKGSAATHLGSKVGDEVKLRIG